MNFVSILRRHTRARKKQNVNTKSALFLLTNTNANKKGTKLSLIKSKRLTSLLFFRILERRSRLLLRLLFRTSFSTIVPKSWRRRGRIWTRVGYFQRCCFSREREVRFPLWDGPAKRQKSTKKKEEYLSPQTRSPSLLLLLLLTLLWRLSRASSHRKLCERRPALLLVFVRGRRNEKMEEDFGLIHFLYKIHRNTRH